MRINGAMRHLTGTAKNARKQSKNSKYNKIKHRAKAKLANLSQTLTRTVEMDG
jgi:hypothetical protein